jgi:hypothetical protein
MQYFRVHLPTRELSELGLAHLLWDALVAEKGDTDGAVASLRAITTAVSKKLINARIVQHGTASVECGPQTPYPSDEVEEETRAWVRRVYA